MAIEEPVVLKLEKDQAIIKDLEINDSRIIDYLNEFDNEQEQEDAFMRALRVGVTTMKLAKTSQQEEFVERKFGEMQRDFRGEIERIEDEVEAKFGDDGDVPKIFDDHLRYFPTGLRAVAKA